MMAIPWIAALFALFVWWFSTGAILWVVKRADGKGRDGHMISVLLGAPLLLVGGAGLVTSLTDASVPGAYMAFLSALAIWAWIELAFLSGVITGPNRSECRDGAAPFERFRQAWGTVAYHELLLFAALVGIAYVSVEAANTLGFWTFAVLFFARISAKLNLFLGVPKINTEFLPDPLAHLPTYFRFSPVNALFPVSITALSLAVACWLERIHGAATPTEVVAFSLLAALTALALIEHWLMVLPFPDEKLWRWMIPAPKRQEKTYLREDGHGL